MTMLREPQIDASALTGRRVAVIGFGNQGRAQAMNLEDAGVDVVVALRDGSPAHTAVRAAGLVADEPRAAVASADVVVMLAPDEAHGQVYRDFVAPHLAPGAAMVFAHGLSIRFGLIEPRDDIDIVLLAPKGPGTALRANFVAGGGMPALFAVAQDASGSARTVALAYGAAIGCARVGLIETSFAEEAEADLFNEQAVVWGAVPELIAAGYDTLVEAGFSADVAYFECVAELKLLADLIEARGIAGMREAISHTAEFAALSGRGRIVTDAARKEMRAVLAEVRSGAFTRTLVADAALGYPSLRDARARDAALAIETTGARLRALRAPSA